MSHRFPIEEAVFPPLQLSESQKDKFNITASTQLTKGLRDYDTFRTWQASQSPNLRYQLHPATWKPIKTCEQLTVYRRITADDEVVTAHAQGSRQRARSRTLETMVLEAAIGSASVTPNEAGTSVSCSESRTSDSEGNMPTLLQVGTIEGTLDDVMYSSVSFDAVETLIQSSYTAEKILDAETLFQLQGPTAEEPFRFLEIKWVVKSNSSSVNSFMWPQDFLFLAATGTLNRQGGERVGYHIMHSVNLGTGYGPLNEKRIVRGRVSSCYFYRQISPNAVDVYMKTNCEPNGVALLSAATSLTQCIKSSLCAHNKKLSWLLAHPTTVEIEAGSARPNNVRRKKRNDCAVCKRSIGAFSRSFSCRVCNKRVCSSCHVKKKLSFSSLAHKSVEQRSIVACTHCLTYARKLDASKVAEEEVKERQQVNRRRGFTQRAQVSSRHSRSNSQPDANKQRRGTGLGRTAEPESSEDEMVFLTGPRKTNQESYQFDLQNLIAQPSWNHNSKKSDVSGVQLLPLAPGPSKTCTNVTKTQSNSRNAGKRLISSKSDFLYIERNSDNFDYNDHFDEGFVDIPPEMPMLESSLPEAEMQFAWGAVVSSPTNKKLPGSLTPSLSKRTENLWSSIDDQSSAPSIPQPTAIHRINAGASTQEVLAKFAELCNAADNVFQVARKHTLTRQENTRLDMSAVD